MPSDTTTNAAPALSNDEASLYDRQIRLWGVEAQSRLRNASVLVIGLTEAGAEISKNLILAGVKRLDIIDDRLMSDIDGRSHFFFPFRRNIPNQKISSAAVPYCKALNPLVEISDVSLDIFDESVDDSFLSKYDLICFIDYDRSKVNLANISSLNNKCRSSNVKFVVCGNFGFFAYVFLDLINFEYFKEIEENTSIDHDLNDDEPPEAKKCKSSKPEKLVKHIEKFVPFEMITRKLHIKSNQSKKFKKLPSAFYIFSVINQYCEQARKNPSSLPEDLNLLGDVYSKTIEDVSLAINDLAFEIQRFSPQ
uniref:THIF-type NAD/FAD binding fold domain-containing protein n=1 Tax=Romanomermis culicivorax TaxID=13658 RepID=A0A915K6F6_ROMCU